MISILPEVDISVSDGGLGTVGIGGFTNVAVVGTCSLGTPNSYYSFTSIDDVKSKLGYGPAAEQVAYTLQVAGGPVYCVPVAPTTLGTIGAVVHTKASSGPSTGLVTASGTAAGTQNIAIQITSSGVVVSGGAMTALVSTDGGMIFGSPVTVPGTGLLTVSGVAFLFSGLFYAGDTVRLPVTSGVAVSSAPIQTHASYGPSLGSATLSGSSADKYDVSILVTRGGMVEPGGSVQFQYSLDGGKSYTSSVSLPGSGVYALGGSGLTATLNNFFNLGDVVKCSTTAPGYGLSDAQAAFSVLESRPSIFGIVHFVGAPGGSTTAIAAANSASFTVGCGAILQGALARYRYSRAFVEASDSTDAELIGAFDSVADTRVSVGGGYVSVLSALDGRSMKVSVQRCNVARLASVPLSESSAHVGTGSLTGVTGIYRDEALSPSLDAARFVTARTFVGAAGFYITSPKMMALSSSDYTEAPNCRVVDTACALTRTALLPRINSRVRLNPATGFILEQEARQIENFLTSQVNSVLMLAPDISNLTVTIQRDWNILSTGVLKVRLRILPLGYLKHIEVDIGFTNPAIAA